MIIQPLPLSLEPSEKVENEWCRADSSDQKLGRKIAVFESVWDYQHVKGLPAASLPPLRGCIVSVLRLDPAAFAAVLAVFLLPEGRACFQEIHHEIRRLEGGLPVR